MGGHRRPDSRTSSGTLRRWRRKTSRATGKRIGTISTPIAWSSGWSARSDLGHPSTAAGTPRGVETGGSVGVPERGGRCAEQTPDAASEPCGWRETRQRPPRSRCQPRHHETHAGKRSSHPRGRSHGAAPLRLKYIDRTGARARVRRRLQANDSGDIPCHVIPLP